MVVAKTTTTKKGTGMVGAINFISDIKFICDEQCNGCVECPLYNPCTAERTIADVRRLSREEMADFVKLVTNEAEKIRKEQ